MSVPKLGRLLIVDDEVELMTALCEMLLEPGYETTGFTSGKEALEMLKEAHFDLLLTDLMMPEMDGIALLQEVLKLDPYMVGIIMTGQGTVQTAVEAMKVGAFDYILKPFKLSELLPILSRAIEVRQLKLENMQLKETVAIYELSQAIAFTLDLNTILNKVVDAAIQQCESDEASIMLPTVDAKELYIAMVRGEHREHILGERVSIENGIAGWVARNHQPLMLDGKVNDSRFEPINPRHDIHSSVSIPMMVGGKLVGILNVNATRRRRPFTLGQVKALSILANIAASALESASLYEQAKKSEGELQKSYEKLRKIIGDTVYAISLTVEMRDPYTAGHQRRVAKLATAIAKEMGFSEDQIDGIHIAGLLHDIGKIVVPSEILSKPGKINEAEFTIIKSHTQIGYEILKAIEFPWPVAQIAFQHHERLNGSGYPSGISDEEILVESKIMAVADVVEAMSSHRPYRAALGVNKALEEVSKNKGILYDADAVDACLKVFEKGFEFE